VDKEELRKLIYTNKNLNNMTPKEYLSQAILLDEKIETNLECLEQLKNRIYSIGGVSYDDTKVSSSGNKDFTDLVAKVSDLESEINVLTDFYVDLKNKITVEINQLSNNTYSLLLLKRYVLNKSLYEIAREMNYSYGAVRNMHGQALEEFKKMYFEK
jgi:hypothetical protein